MSLIDSALEGLDGNLRQAVIKEFQTGYQREMVNAGINAKRLAKVTYNTDHKSIDGIGRLRMRIDSTLYHHWGQKLGYDCWKDNQFLREVERDNPEVRVKCGGTKLQVGWSGSSKKFSKKY